MRIFLVSLLVGFVAARLGIAAEDSSVSTPEKTLPRIFTEDFEKGADRWDVSDKGSWKLHRNGDGKAFGIIRRKSEYKPDVRSPGHIALIKDVNVTDFVLTFKVRSTNDTGGHRDCCVFFGYQDATHFYYVHLGAKPDKVSGQVTVVDGAPRAPITKNDRDVPWDDKWHTVKLVRSVKKGTIDIYFDDMEKPHLSAVDKRFGRGRVGIGSFDDMNDFDDIELQGK